MMLSAKYHISNSCLISLRLTASRQFQGDEVPEGNEEAARGRISVDTPLAIDTLISRHCCRCQCRDKTDSAQSHDALVGGRRWRCWHRLHRGDEHYAYARNDLSRGSLRVNMICSDNSYYPVSSIIRVLPLWPSPCISFCRIKYTYVKLN